MGAIYLDHAAAEPVCDRVLDGLREQAEYFYNPSAVYQSGSFNYDLIAHVRKKIAETINCSPEEIIFTSGASESNSLAINGLVDANQEKYGKIRIYESPIEHSSILYNRHVQTRYVDQGNIEVDSRGYIDPNQIEKMLKKDLLTKGFFSDPDDTPFLVCIQHANNEIGSIQPIKEISEKIHKYPNGFLLVDAAQTFGKIRIDVKEMGIDLMSVSAGKIGGIRGTGFLYVRKGVELMPQICGTQENRMRGGTYFDLGIWALGIAVDEIDYRKDTVLMNRRDYLLELLLKNDNVRLIGKRTDRLSNNIFIEIQDLDVDSQQLVGILDLMGYQVSAGSACHAGEKELSHVLKAIGEKDVKTAIRITIGMDNTVDDLRTFAEDFAVVNKMHRKTRSRKNG